ncbi:Gfo/Idh/MocA family protein [Dictyobacter formicarum]|uniref:Oxidoreductase n=1 Tax=Dictyobacter formicarum TaxID=2778368 RepID=A0ABQ3VQ52_9CHLR|nr:Gfo/Idh/MocA family oxidoreductase [Dictyobacter formicarum]GHO87513.1 oxidoreductase [Dictyobacter formicarum]
MQSETKHSMDKKVERYVKYNFEYERKLRVCFIGAGGHSFRNVYPTFQYAPVDLVAIADIQGERAEAYARQFGARSYYTDYRQMLDHERPDAVFIVTSYHPDGRVQATDIALDALAHGSHVWMEKPTAASTAEIRQLMEASKVHQRYVMTGLKKIFTPGMEKVKQLISTLDFGRISSCYLRYPQAMPAFEQRQDLRQLTGLLDHIYHPGAVLGYLMGKVHRLSYEWEPHNGGSITTLRFHSGAVGTLHMCAGISASSPLEYLEIVGEKANIVVQNGLKITYYRKASGLGYGRSASYLVDEKEAPLYWEPEFSLGQLYNKNLFYLGYVPEVLHFCESVLAGRAPEKGTLEQSLEIMKLFEAYRNTPAGEMAIVDPDV